jgi:hypothetical protein
MTASTERARIDVGEGVVGHDRLDRDSEIGEVPCGSSEEPRGGPASFVRVCAST